MYLATRVVFAAVLAVLFASYVAQAAENFYIREGMTTDPAVLCKGANNYGDKECSPNQWASFTISVGILLPLIAPSRLTSPPLGI